jgi:hypothetical protein
MGWNFNGASVSVNGTVVGTVLTETQFTNTTDVIYNTPSYSCSGTMTMTFYQGFASWICAEYFSCFTPPPAKDHFFYVGRAQTDLYYTEKSLPNGKPKGKLKWNKPKPPMRPRNIQGSYRCGFRGRRGC